MGTGLWAPDGRAQRPQADASEQLHVGPGITAWQGLGTCALGGKMATPTREGLGPHRCVLELGRGGADSPRRRGIIAQTPCSKSQPAPPFPPAIKGHPGKTTVSSSGRQTPRGSVNTVCDPRIPEGSRLQTLPSLCLQLLRVVQVDSHCNNNNTCAIEGIPSIQTQDHSWEATSNLL